MPNPIYQVIKSSLEKFTKTGFTITEKIQESTEDKYYLITAELKEAPQLSMKMPGHQAQQYKVLETHITVFEHMKKEEGKGRTAYHLTVQVSGAEKSNKFTLRSYFDVTGDSLYINCKDEKEGQVELQRNDADLGCLIKLAAPFNTAFQACYHVMNQQALKKHNVLVGLATTKSSVLAEEITAKSYPKVKEYIGYLNQIISQMEEWNQFQFSPDIQLLTHFRRLKAMVDNEVRLYVKSTESKENSEAETKELQPSSNIPAIIQIASSETKSNTLLDNMPSLEAVLKVFVPAVKMIQQYAALTVEIAQAQSSNDYAKKINAIKDLTESAYQEFTKLLAQSRSIPKPILTILLQIIPTVFHDDFVKAVKFKQHLALEMMLEHSKHAVGQASILLEESYNSNDVKAFKLLLDAKVDYHYRNQSGCTLLMRACLDESSEIMVCLLQAGASQYDRTFNGYTALGYLTSRDKKKPNLQLVTLFLENCVDVDIDLMQGQTTFSSTALAFACQNGWKKAAELYLRYGADPSLARTTDMLSSLAICAAKGYDDILAILLRLNIHLVLAQQSLQLRNLTILNVPNF